MRWKYCGISETTKPGIGSRPTRPFAVTVDELVGVVTRPGGGKPATEAEARAFIESHDKNGDGVVSRSEQSAKKNDSSDVKVAIVGTTAPSLWGEVPTDTWKD